MRSERLDAKSADRAFTAKLSLPKGAGPFPAIVGVHPADDGSRDHYLFRHLESVLPPIGIAVARFDRRGDDVPLLDQARDVEAVVDVLAARADIDAWHAANADLLRAWRDQDAKRGGYPSPF